MVFSWLHIFPVIICDVFIHAICDPLFPDIQGFGTNAMALWPYRELHVDHTVGLQGNHIGYLIRPALCKRICACACYLLIVQEQITMTNK